MTLTLNFPPDVEAGLFAQAQAEGLAVSDYLQNLVRGQIAGNLGARSDFRPAYKLPPEDWVRTFQAWTESHREIDLPVLSDKAISRDSIYSDRGL